MSYPIEWTISESRVDYADALNFMEARVKAIHEGTANELVWLLEHPPLYTAGTSAQDTDLTNELHLPVINAGRGGQYTYHGPGQRVAYVMINVAHRGKDVRAFVYALESWIINTLAQFDVRGERRQGRVGVWVDRSTHNVPTQEDKIAAIGVRLRKWVSFHGISLNVNPDLTHFTGIVPCGIAQQEFGVTSLHDLGINANLSDVDTALKNAFENIVKVEVQNVPPPTFT